MAMNAIRKRKEDHPESSDFEQRSILSRYREVIYIITFLLGGGASQIGISYVTPGYQELTQKVNKNEIAIQANNAEIRANTKALIQHIEASRELDQSKQDLQDEKFKTINEKLDELKKLSEQIIQGSKAK